MAEPDKPDKSAKPDDLLPVEKGDPVIDWRYDELVSHGLDPDRANRSALDKDFDLSLFRALRLAGADPDLAYDIVR